MFLEAWLFSARLAWRRSFFKWFFMLTLLMVIFGSAIFLWKLLSVRAESGTFVLHYNIYLGIDEVRSWPWVFLLPSVWLALTMIDLAVAFGTYRYDPHFAISLLTFAFFWCLPWLVALYYLILTNL